MANPMRKFISPKKIISEGKRQYSHIRNLEENWKNGPFQNQSFTGNILRAKMQEPNPSMSWNTSPAEGEKVKTEKEKEEESTVTMDPNSSMWRAITSEHKEIEEKPKDQTCSIRNYYRDRWIQHHKEKRSDNITKQAVKVFSEEPVPQQSSGQASHEASIYRKLTHKQIPNDSKPENMKETTREAVESLKISRRISADQFNEDDFKNASGKTLYRSPEIPLISQNQPRFDKPNAPEESKPNVKFVPKNENWSVLDSENTKWRKEKHENGNIVAQDPIVTFKPDL